MGSKLADAFTVRISLRGLMLTIAWFAIVTRLWDSFGFSSQFFWWLFSSLIALSALTQFAKNASGSRPYSDLSKAIRVRHMLLRGVGALAIGYVLFGEHPAVFEDRFGFRIETPALDVLLSNLYPIGIMFCVFPIVTMIRKPNKYSNWIFRIVAGTIAIVFFLQLVFMYSWFLGEFQSVTIMDRLGQRRPLQLKAQLPEIDLVLRESRDEFAKVSVLGWCGLTATIVGASVFLAGFRKKKRRVSNVGLLLWSGGVLLSVGFLVWLSQHGLTLVDPSWREGTSWLQVFIWLTTLAACSILLTMLVFPGKPDDKIENRLSASDASETEPPLLVCLLGIGMLTAALVPRWNGLFPSEWINRISYDGYFLLVTAVLALCYSARVQSWLPRLSRRFRIRFVLVPIMLLLATYFCWGAVNRLHPASFVRNSFRRRFYYLFWPEFSGHNEWVTYSIAIVFGVLVFLFILCKRCGYDGEYQVSEDSVSHVGWHALFVGATLLVAIPTLLVASFALTWLAS